MDIPTQKRSSQNEINTAAVYCAHSLLLHAGVYRVLDLMDGCLPFRSPRDGLNETLHSETNISVGTESTRHTRRHSPHQLLEDALVQHPFVLPAVVVFLFARGRTAKEVRGTIVSKCEGMLHDRGDNEGDMREKTCLVVVFQAVPMLLELSQAILAQLGDPVSQMRRREQTARDPVVHRECEEHTAILGIRTGPAHSASLAVPP